jgi:signal peptidase I
MLLALAAVAAVAGAAVVVIERVGFAPVLSPSMRPAFAPGDLLITRAEPARDVRVGQVVALPVPDAPGQRYVHRIVSVTHKLGDPVVVTKGDNNPTKDPQALRITSNDVPLVVGHVPGAGRLALVTRGAPLRIAIFAFIAGCILVSVKRLLLDR